MPKALIVAMRTAAYLVRTFLILAIFVWALWFAFGTAMNVSNIYILTTEGLQKRANTVLLGADEELEKYFTARFLGADKALRWAEYENAGVKSFDYKLKVERAFAYPWDTVGKATVVERIVRLDTGATASISPDPNQPSPSPKPVYEDGKYEIIFVKDNKGRWYIDELILKEKPEPSYTLPLLTLPPGYVMPTPTPTPTPTKTP